MVAVLRGGEALPSPDPDLRVEPGDTLVVCGDPASVQRAEDLLRGE